MFVIIKSKLSIFSTYFQANGPETFSGMFHSTTILECAVYITCFYLSFTFLNFRFFGQEDFMRKWKISPATAMDIACKTISAGFALSATIFGIFILWVSPEYTPIQKDRSSFFVDRVMVWAMSYFIYDFFAMYHVYLARKDAKASDNLCQETSLSQPMRLDKLDASKEDCELITSTSNPNDNLVSLSKSVNSNCDKNRKSISSEDISGVSMNGISKTKPR